MEKSTDLFFLLSKAIFIIYSPHLTVSTKTTTIIYKFHQTQLI